MHYNGRATCKMDNIDFKVDSKVMKDAFTSGREDIYEFGQIITASRTLFSFKFTNSRVEFVRQQINAVAHTLTK